MLEILQDPQALNYAGICLNVLVGGIVTWRAGRNKHERTLLSASMRRIEAVEKRNEALNKALLNEATARARLEQQVRDDSEARADLESQLADVRARLDRKSAESEQLRRDLDAAKATHSRDITALQERQDAQEEEIAALQSERDQLADHVRALSEQVTQLGQTPAPAPSREYPRAANGQFAKKKGRSK